MRVMVLSTPFPSHLAPMTPLLWALRAAGHEVLVAGQPDITGAAHAAGFCTATIGHPFHGTDILRIGLGAGQRPLRAFGKPDPKAKSGTWSVHAGYLLPSYLDFARQWRPDLIISEQLELTGAIIGATLGVPSVGHRLGVDPLSGPARELGRVVLAATCERLGLPGLPDPTLWLDPCPPGLQLPELPAATPIRPVPFNGAGARPDWARRHADRQVCVSLGRLTLQLNGVPLLRSIVDSFADDHETEVFVTAEPEYAAELGPVPPTVRVVPPTPLTLLLPHCDAVIHHGGVGSMLTSLHFGLPQLALPQNTDQFAGAERLAALGAGISVDTADEQDDPAVLRAALGTLLGEPGYRHAAGDLRAAMAAMPSPAEVARELGALAAAT
ncbi:UDP:flavonoid glycosyltransferase YjiC, YdhE family [Amycolatopsis xylanica]|uniref:UDP:flavonoid glycosyltransferase YjiC, YdhE family n=1 Tax=Amycolatopsis xylanica TaxID=589385 RepID=A0A1H2VPH9_9PSEU|nr:nucleotide disphospho-sugar-binding domain-containing protein [Amycolatopsis xylanica]SDW69779.1 UDP:flavonoid glycosyltransferase YjiC, YdhE family [Amycolatopsis xylanica]